MVITALYALNYNRQHKNPYPLDNTNPDGSLKASVKN
jgi:arginine:agmatine antiporter